MNPAGTLPKVRHDVQGQVMTLRFSGDFTTLWLDTVEAFLFKDSRLQAYSEIACDMSGISGFDTAGALMMLQFRKQQLRHGRTCRIEMPEGEFRRLYELVAERRYEAEQQKKRRSYAPVTRVGRWTTERFAAFKTLLTFIGYASVIFASYLRSFRAIRYKEIIFEMNESAIKALGIVGLITFLIGVVVAYQSSLQLKLYGANIFIVDMLGIGIMRELAPMLVAIVVAGRSGSAYAAQIGVMKITEELDAMRTMGFDPYAFLVLPRLIALVVMMPFLIFFADIAGIAGGMIVSNIELDIEYRFFLERFAEVVRVDHFWIGMVKGPFFGLLIATIGIYRGLQVKNDTQSIGFNTTKSVVESIFAVIICDAIFSIIFTNLGI
jgi:phospholipid/cholesterol/gamma-HCH transport system permease protein